METLCDKLSSVNLLEQLWLQLMYYTACLPHDHNFREVDEVQDRDKH